MCCLAFDLQATELKLKVETAERERDFYFEKLRDIEILCQAPELQVQAVACLPLQEGGACLRCCGGWLSAADAGRGMQKQVDEMLGTLVPHQPVHQCCYAPQPVCCLQEIPAIRIVEKILYAADSGGPRDVLLHPGDCRNAKTASSCPPLEALCFTSSTCAPRPCQDALAWPYLDSID